MRTSNAVDRAELIADEGAPIRYFEVLGTSHDSFSGALRDAVRTSARTIRNVRTAEVLSQRASVDMRGDVETFLVACKIGFALEPPSGERLGNGEVLPPEIESESGSRDERA